MTAATPRLLSPFRPRLRSTSGLVCRPSDSAAGVLSRQPADQERQRGGEMFSFVQGAFRTVVLNWWRLWTHFSYLIMKSRTKFIPEK